VLPLARCPVIDQLGQDLSLQFNSDRRTQAATEGVTRSLRPYRWGDPTRLIHWRTSARYGELRVRELETLTGGQELVIALDNASWHHRALTEPSETFEQMVIAAASLYFYANQRQLNAKLWTAATGLVQGRQAVLETLAAVQAGSDRQAELPMTTIVWLTQNSLTLNALPAGSRWLLWTEAGKALSETRSSVSDRLGMAIDAEAPLQSQLQRSLSRGLDNGTL
jgi:uncharacterized protein (DUF58 family)